MGACMSSKSGSKKARYTTVPPPYANKNKTLIIYKPIMDATEKTQNSLAKNRRSGPYTRGQTTLFGFKRRVASASPAAALDNAKTEHKTCSLESLDSCSPGTSGKSSPRATRASSAANVRANRFGFKSPVAATTNKVADSNANMVVNQEYKNMVNKDKPRSKGGGKIVKPIKAGTPTQGQRTPPGQQLTLAAGQTSRFTLQTSLLPTPQFPIRLASAEQDHRTKGAKTLANNTARIIHGSDSNSSNGSLNADSGIGSQRSADEVVQQEITILQSSPGSANRRSQRQQAMRKRELEVVVSGKSFDVRDLKDPQDDMNVITEISVISLPTSVRTNQKPAMRVAPQQVQQKTLRPTTQPQTGMVRERKLMYQQRPPGAIPTLQAARSGTPGARSGANAAATRANAKQVSEGRSVELSAARMSGEWEEKAYIDRVNQEKSRDLMPDCYNDWGQGEAMAEEFSYADDGTKVSNVQPRPIHLAIEEARFAAIAAGDSSLIEDERSPVDSLMSNSPPSSESSEVHDKDDKEDKDKASPESPGTPTNASNSLSLSEGRDRDFLIDDEIADQPGLMFDEQVEELASSLGALEVTESNPETLKAPPTTEALNVEVSAPVRKCSSVGTLSPCESIASDDLMIDFDRSEQSAFNVSREDSRLGSQQSVADCAISHQEVFREWSHLLATEQQLGSGRNSRLLRSRPNSTPDSPHSLDSRLRSTPSSSAAGSPLRVASSLTGSPLRPPRQPPSDDDAASYIWLDRTTYQQMCQDIVSMKTMLLKLKRLFQENEENSLMAETLNPFDSSLKNGLFYSLAGGEGAGDMMDAGRQAEVTIQEEVVELRRQAVFLQQQLDERERTIKLLQVQMSKYTAGDTSEAMAVDGDREKANAATQTERMRPVSAGPSLLQSLPTDSANGPLVSLNDGWRQHRKSSLNGRRLSSPTPTRRLSGGLTSANLVSSIPTLKSQHNGASKS